MDTSAAGSVTIPATYNGLPVTSIGSSAFRNCSNLTSVTISDSVVSVGNNAFSHCSSLAEIIISESVTSIGSEAFTFCSSLTEIMIPKGVTSIGTYIFWYCNELTEINVAEGNTVYHSEGNCLIETETKTLISGCQNSVIPTDGSVTRIISGSFSSCYGLIEITIPASVTSIERFAFMGCLNLTSVTFEITEGWWIASSSTATSGTEIASSDLADPSTAAEYLASHGLYYWHRS